MEDEHNGLCRILCLCLWGERKLCRLFDIDGLEKSYTWNDFYDKMVYGENWIF